jgi:retinol dehydrogenase-12
MAEPQGLMSGKVCVVTGATAGIGRMTAEGLARLGARVILVGRNPRKCAAAVSEIRQATGHSEVESLVADLSSQAEIRRLAEQVRARYPRLDVLVNNAGAYFPQRIETVDGIEMTFALNHLSYFLLTNLVLDRLLASAPARIVNVASNAHKGVRMNFDDLQGRRRYNGWFAYAQSKLANVLFTDELARRLDGTGVTANVLHPGFVASNFFEGKGPLGWIFGQIARVVALSPAQGAQTSIYLASSPEVEGVSGRYFVKQKPVASSPVSRDEAAARRLWKVSEELTGLTAPVA